MKQSVSKKTKKNSPTKKTTPKRPPQQKRLFWGCFALFLLISLVTIGKILSYLNSPSIASTPQDKRNYTFTNLSSINLVFKTDNIYSLFYNPFEKTAAIIKIPDDTYLDLSFGFGKYPTRSIYDLGQGEKPPIGPRLFKHTISSLEGEVMEAVVISQDPKDFRSPAKMIEEIKQNPLAVFTLTQRLNSDLSKIELFRLFWGLKDVPANNLKIVDLGSSSITRSLLLADGTRGLGIDQSKLDLLIQSKFKDSKIVDEGLSIGVINGTPHPRLAESVARIISNMGGRVIFMSSSKSNYNQSLLIGKPSYTTTRLIQLFAPNCLDQEIFLLSYFKKPKCVITDPEILSSRAEINLVLGEDFYTNWYNK